MNKIPTEYLKKMASIDDCISQTITSASDVIVSPKTSGGDIVFTDWQGDCKAILSDERKSKTNHLQTYRRWYRPPQ